MVTQVVVGKDDPDFQNPTKYIGSSYDDETAEKLKKERGWTMKHDVARGWRRVVPSPWPIRIVESASISAMLANDAVVIAAGGGGIPVLDNDGELSGIDAVIDKDRASAILAAEIKAEKL